MIVITGAAGKLGQLVISSLLKTTPAKQIVAVVRDVEKAKNLSALGVQVRKGDYSKPETLTTAFVGAKKVLLISGSEIGQRIAQHKAVIEAAKAAKVQQFAYTSLLRADTSKLFLAQEHKATEEAIRASGLTFTILRNGWYLENQTAALAESAKNGAIIGASADGKFSAAARADYADAAAVILTGTGHDNKIYELAGDGAYTLSELAAEASKQFNKQIIYKNLSEDDYVNTLKGFGLPEAVAKMLGDSAVNASKGELESKSIELQKLIGRATTTMAEAVSASHKDATVNSAK